MNTIELSAVKRGDLGKTGSKLLRADDMVPGVVYFNGEATHISVSAKALKKVLYAADTFLINVDLEGEAFQAVVKHADFHPVTEKMLHIELQKVTNDKKVVVSLPIKMLGTSVGVVKGGKLLTKLRKIKVKGFASELPAFVGVDVSHLDLGDNILIKEVDFKGLEIVSNGTTAIASVEIPRSLKSTLGK